MGSLYASVASWPAVEGAESDGSSSRMGGRAVSGDGGAEGGSAKGLHGSNIQRAAGGVVLIEQEGPAWAEIVWDEVSEQSSTALQAGACVDDVAATAAVVAAAIEQFFSSSSHIIISTNQYINHTRHPFSTKATTYLYFIPGTMSLLIVQQQQYESEYATGWGHTPGTRYSRYQAPGK